MSVLCIATAYPPANVNASNSAPSTARRAFGFAVAFPAAPLPPHPSPRTWARRVPHSWTRGPISASRAAVVSKILASAVSRRRSRWGCRPTRRFFPNTASSAISIRSAPARRAETSSTRTLSPLRVLSPFLPPSSGRARPGPGGPHPRPGTTPTPARTGARAQIRAACEIRRSPDSPGTRRRSATEKPHHRRTCVRSSATTTLRWCRRTTGAPSAADRRAAHRASRCTQTECAQDPNARRPIRQRAGPSAPPASGHSGRRHRQSMIGPNTRNVLFGGQLRPRRTGRLRAVQDLP